jgi:hypothetical protein
MAGESGEPGVADIANLFPGLLGKGLIPRLRELQEDIREHIARRRSLAPSLFVGRFKPTEGELRTKASELFGEDAHPAFRDIADPAIFTHGTPEMLLSAVQKALVALQPEFGPGRLAAENQRQADLRRTSPEGQATEAAATSASTVDEAFTTTQSLISRLPSADQGRFESQMAIIHDGLANLDPTDPDVGRRRRDLLALRSNLDGDIIRALETSVTKAEGDRLRDETSILRIEVRRDDGTIWSEAYEVDRRGLNPTRKTDLDIKISDPYVSPEEIKRLDLAKKADARAADAEGRAIVREDRAVVADQLDLFYGSVKASDFGELWKIVRDGNQPDAFRSQSKDQMLQIIGEGLAIAGITDPSRAAALAQGVMPGQPLTEEALQSVYQAAGVRAPVTSPTAAAAPATFDDRAFGQGFGEEFDEFGEGTRQKNNLAVANLVNRFADVTRVVATSVATQRRDPEEGRQLLEAEYALAFESIDPEGDFDPGYDVDGFLTSLTDMWVNGDLTMAQALGRIDVQQRRTVTARNDARTQRNENRNLRIQGRTENQRRREQQFGALANIDSAQQARDLQLFQMIAGMSLPPATPGAVLGGSDVIAELARRTGGPVAEPSPIGGPIAFPSSAGTFDAARRKVMETFATTPLEELIQ